MRANIASVCCLILGVLLVFEGSACGDPYHVEIDISSLAGRDISLDFQLWDNSEILYDSWVEIDNVLLEGGPLTDFESGLDGFDHWDKDPSVDVAPGSLNGLGSSLLRMDEYPLLWPVLAYKDYAGSPATTLSFDFEMTASTTKGIWGLDYFVCDVVDWSDNPDDRTIWDAVIADSTGIYTSQETNVAVIPAPGALLLCILGLGTGSARILRRNRAK